MWTLVVGVTVAMRGGMSGAILVGRTAAVGVLSPEEMVLLVILVGRTAAVGVLSPEEMVLLVGVLSPEEGFVRGAQS